MLGGGEMLNPMACVVQFNELSARKHHYYYTNVATCPEEHMRQPSTQHRTRQKLAFGRTVRELVESPNWEGATDKTHRTWSFLFWLKQSSYKVFFLLVVLLEWVGPWPCFAPFLSGQLSCLCLFGNLSLEGNWKELGMELWCPWGGSESMCLPTGTHHPLLESPTVVWSEEKCGKWLGGPWFYSHSNRFVGFMVLVDNN